jgi:hypothetical protein
MAEVTPPAPSAEELRRELERLRAAQPAASLASEAPAPLQPSVAQLLRNRVLRALLLWALLILAFLAIWQFLGPSR